MEYFDLQQLEYFLHVCQWLNFGVAAERAGITQPALTRQIQNLEKNLGCKLFVRSEGPGRQTRLTRAGEKLETEARRVLEMADYAARSTQRLAQGLEGELRVGVPPSVMLTGMTDAVREFRKQHPGVAFTLREMGTGAMEQALRAGQIDLGFLRETQLRGDMSRLFLTEPLVAVLPVQHRLAAKPAFKLRALKGEDFVFFPRTVGPDFHDVLMRHCGDAGFVPKIVQEATQWQTIVSLVEAGMGVTIAPACVEKFQWPGVTYRRLPEFTTHIYAAFGDRGSATAERFFSIAQRATGPAPSASREGAEGRGRAGG